VTLKYGLRVVQGRSIQNGGVRQFINGLLLVCVSIALYCTIFQLFDVNVVTLCLG